MTELLRETIQIGQYKAEIVGTQVVDILKRSDQVKQFLIDNLGKINFLEIRRIAKTKFGVIITKEYGSTKKQLWKRNT